MMLHILYNRRHSHKDFRIHSFRKTPLISFLFILLMVLTTTMFLSSCGGRGTEANDEAKTSNESSAEEKVAKGSSSAEGEKGGEKGDKEEAQENGENKKENGGIPVEVSEIIVKDISSYISSTTNIETEYEATVLSETDGKVMTIVKEEGMRVFKGELLAQLDDSEKQIILKKAKIRAENEAGNHERAKELFAQNLLSADEFDKVKFQYELAESDYEEAEYNLNKTKIVSPFDGRITQRHIKLGQNIKPSDRLFTVANFDPLIAHIYLPEKDALLLRVGQQVEVSVTWESEKKYPGYIERISPIVDSQTGTVKITIYARNLPDSIKPGSFVAVNIIKEIHENALLIPKRAIIKDLQEDFVYIVDENLAKRVKVQLGFEDNGYVEILSGLSQEQKVISVGQGGLKDGSKVKIIQG